MKEYDKNKIDFLEERSTWQDSQAESENLRNEIDPLRLEEERNINEFEREKDGFSDHFDHITNTEIHDSSSFWY